MDLLLKSRLNGTNFTHFLFCLSKDLLIQFIMSGVGWALLIGALCIYFIPTALAWRKRNVWAIFALNLLLGWTVIGWIIALVWGLTKDPK